VKLCCVCRSFISTPVRVPAYTKNSASLVLLSCVNNRGTAVVFLPVSSVSCLPACPSHIACIGRERQSPSSGAALVLYICGPRV
jgi:hypothetical protein